MLFFDTSALVKRYAQEPGIEAVDRLFEWADGVIISSLAVIEMTSALRRKYNEGEITVRQRDDLLVAFFAEATEARRIVPVDATAFEVAFDLVLNENLRTRDALQLGTALSRADGDLDLTFVCADRKLIQVARTRGLSTNHPVDMEGSSHRPRSNFIGTDDLVSPVYPGTITLSGQHRETASRPTASRRGGVRVTTSIRYRVSTVDSR